MLKYYEPVTTKLYCTLMKYTRKTVEPLIVHTLKNGQPPCNGQTVCHLLSINIPQGQPLNNGQDTRSQLFHCIPTHSSFVSFSRAGRGAAVLFSWFSLHPELRLLHQQFESLEVLPDQREVLYVLSRHQQLDLRVRGRDGEFSH